jgi:hypothetical protein
MDDVSSASTTYKGVVTADDVGFCSGGKPPNKFARAGATISKQQSSFRIRFESDWERIVISQLEESKGKQMFGLKLAFTR